MALISIGSRTRRLCRGWSGMNVRDSLFSSQLPAFVLVRKRRNKVLTRIAIKVHCWEEQPPADQRRRRHGPTVLRRGEDTEGEEKENGGGRGGDVGWGGGRETYFFLSFLLPARRRGRISQVGRGFAQKHPWDSLCLVIAPQDRQKGCRDLHGHTHTHKGTLSIACCRRKNCNVAAKWLYL